MKRPQKYLLGPADLVPLAYWARRYGHGGLAPLAFRLVVIDLAILLAILLARPDGQGAAAALWQGVAYLAVFHALYELGYFLNDYFDPRDRAAARRHWKEDRRWLLPAAAVRIAFAAGLSALALPVFGTGRLALLTGAILAVFLLHGLLPRSLRALSYLALQLLIFLSPLWAIPGAGNPFDTAIYLSVTLPPVVALSLNYWMGKGLWRDRWIRRLRGRMLALNAGCCLAGAVPAALAAPAALPALLGLAGLSTLLWLGFTGAGFLRCYNAAFGADDLFHAHTYLSHDARTTIRQLDRFARANGLQRVHLTDHAEDFTRSKFARQARAIDVANRVLGEGRVVHGLEYDLLGEHLLCLGMRRFVPFEAADPSLLPQLRQACDRIVWAHPRPALKRLLTDRAYRRGLARILGEVDGVELVNFKSISRPGFWWRHLAVGYMAYATSRDFFIVGSDIHTMKMIGRYGDGFPHATLGHLSDTHANVRRLIRFTNAARRFGGLRTGRKGSDAGWA